MHPHASMAESLGGRLTRAGLVTRADLADIVAAAPAHDAALVRALVRRGVAEDALAGFFLSEGFGPLLEPIDLERAENVWAMRLPSSMALDFLALPLRAATDGVVVAMAAPSDAHIVRELGRVLGARVLATVARPGHIERRIRALHPAAIPEIVHRPGSDPPVLELTRRRTSTAPRGFDTGFRAPDGNKEGKLGPRLALPDDEPAMPLVRHKPSMTPPVGVQPIVPPQAAKPDAAAPSKTFTRPQRTERGVPGDWRRGSEPRRSNTAPLIPAAAPNPKSSPTIAVRPVTIAPQPPASSLEGALTNLAEGSTPASPSSTPPAPSTPPASAAAAEVPALHTATLPPAEPSRREPTPSPQATVAPPTPPAPAPPPPAPASAPLAAEERWDLPSSPAVVAPARVRDPANKLSSRATNELPTIKAAPGDIGAILAAMRAATDRDDVVRLACEGATTVARTSVFFALRKGVLKGWDGAGPGVRRDSVRNLWIPTSSASTFKKVLDSKSGTVGPYGTSVADGLFRAAVGSRGGDLMVQPVVVTGKVVGMLCVDDLRPGPLGAHRVEVLAQTIGDAFVRIISAGKDT